MRGRAGPNTVHDGPAEPFADSRMLFEQTARWLGGAGAAGLSHAELEAQLDAAGRKLLCQLFQDHLDLRAATERRCEEVVDVDGICRGRTERGHARTLATVFGDVTVTRIAYRQPGHANLHPADAALNLPAESYSHGLRRLTAIEAARGSYDAAAEAIGRATGHRVGHRQLGQLIERATTDFDSFYATRLPPAADSGDVLVLSADGKGIVMRHDSLRATTAKAAADVTPKLASRLSKGEKRGRKRMATVGAVYDITPIARTPADIMPVPDHDPIAGPKAINKWLTASVTDDATTTIAAIFAEADRRDPDHARTWIALVDGNTHQINRITAEADNRGTTVTILIDFIHVIEYIWGAAWCFFDEGETAAETWVAHQTSRILQGHAHQVASTIARKARNLDPKQRTNANACITYLRNKAPYLDYPTALASGWPIATGIIEGACRHLICDRLDITGARWSLNGAEAILKLRAITANGDFNDYYQHHLSREHQRIHHSRYANHRIPQAA